MKSNPLHYNLKVLKYVSFLFVTFCCTSTPLLGQDLIWAKSFNLQSTHIAYNVKTNLQGEVYLSGTFYETMDIDPGPGVYNLTAIGDADIFLVKLDATGNLLWGKNMGGKFGALLYPGSMELDEEGNIIIAGNFMDTVDFDPGPGISNLVSHTNEWRDIFTAKYDSKGQLIWAKSIPVGKHGQCHHLSIDGLGNIYLKGSFRDSIDLDPDSGNGKIKMEGAGFIGKFNAKGDFQWVKFLVGSDVGSINADKTGNCYASVRFYDSIKFIGFKPSPVQIKFPGYASCILKIDSMGDYEWIKGLEVSAAPKISLDKEGNVLLSGTYKGMVDFNPGSGTHFLESKEEYDGFVLKLDRHGEFVWVGGIEGYYSPQMRGLKSDENGNVIISGNFLGTVDFDPDPLVSAALNSSSSEYSSYITTWDSEGKFICAGAMVGDNKTVIFSMDLDQDQSILVFGIFRGTTDFDPDRRVSYYLTANQSSFVPFIAKYSGCPTLGGSEKTLKSLMVYPNPAKNKLEFNVDPQTLSHIEIIDITGRIIEVPNPSNNSIDVSQLPSGMYLLSMDRNNQKLIQRFIKE